jgi:hypothetical protein
VNAVSALARELITAVRAVPLLPNPWRGFARVRVNLCDIEAQLDQLIIRVPAELTGQRKDGEAERHHTLLDVRHDRHPNAGLERLGFSRRICACPTRGLRT